MGQNSLHGVGDRARILGHGLDASGHFSEQKLRTYVGLLILTQAPGGVSASQGLWEFKAPALQTVACWES
jgi:hypothetical protein